MLSAPLDAWRFLRSHPLTSEQPTLALSRYLRWQLGSFLLGQPVAVGFVNDARLLVRRGMTGATGNIYAGLHEFADMSFALHALRADELFVDIGANVGSYTVLAAKAVGARVICFEPIAATHAALLDNLRLNAIEARVDARRACVGSRPGQVRMTTALDTVNHVLPDGAAATPESDIVDCVRLDDALGGATPRLIKLDVEGYELEVLRGAEHCLSAPELQALIMELNASGDRYARPDAELEQIVRRHGFQRCSYHGLTRRLEPASGASAPGASNVIFVRDLARMQERVRSAPAFRVLGREI